MAVAFDLDGGDFWAMDFESSFYTFVCDDASDGDGPANAVALHFDDDAVEDLDALFGALDDAYVHVDGVADV